MSKFDSEQSRFEPALLLALTVMTGVALGRDVFYDVATQAVAMTALALLISALVLPLLGLARALGGRPRNEVTAPKLAEGQLVAVAVADAPGADRQAAPVEPPAPPCLERNAGTSGVKVRASASFHNDNQGWAGSRLTHSGLR
ncbi:MAG: hypothetical protein WC314_13580 [Vulcanimicrobiota bacterium]